MGIGSGPVNPPDKCANCSVNLDDAFGGKFKKGEVHKGPWKAPSGWGETPRDKMPKTIGDIQQAVGHDLQPMPWPP